METASKLNKNLIDIDDRSDWKNIMVFAANASGKTKTANALKKLIEKNNLICNLFSNSTIENMIDVDSKKIFIGMAASEQKKNEEIINNINEGDTIKKFVKDSYGKIQGLKESSAFIRSLNLSKLDSSSIFNSLKIDRYKNGNSALNFDDVIKFDQILNFKIIIDIIEIIGNIDEFKIEIYVDDENNNIIISNEILKAINIVKEDIIQNNRKSCLICGYTSDNLKSEIENRKNYILKDNASIPQKIISIYEKIKNEDKDQILAKYINYYASDLEEKKKQVLNYYNLFESVSDSIINRIFELNVDKKNTVIELKKEFLINQKKVEKERNKLTNRLKFEETVKNEFKKLVILPQNLELKFNDEGVLELFISGELQSVKDVLSESEKKRLALAVLYSQISHSRIDYIIFDDPIDSYDDYYIEAASSYILTEIFQKIRRKNIEITIFTHSFPFVLISAKNKSLKKIIYYQDPCLKFNSEDEKIKDINIFYKQISNDMIKSINDQEILIAYKIFRSNKGKLEYIDKEFAMLSLSNTLRNVVLDIGKKIKVNFVDDLVTTETEKIESNYIHFSIDNINAMELKDIYLKVFNESKIKLKSAVSGKQCSALREEWLNKDFDNIVSNNLLYKLILHKIMRISGCKYKIDKKLYTILLENNISIEKINKVLNAKCLPNKISKAKRFCSDIRVNQILEISKVFGTILNDYSHGTVRMFPPYLSTNIRDVAKLDYEIEKI